MTAEQLAQRALLPGDAPARGVFDVARKPAAGCGVLRHAPGVCRHPEVRVHGRHVSISRCVQTKRLVWTVIVQQKRGDGCLAKTLVGFFVLFVLFVFSQSVANYCCEYWQQNINKHQFNYF